MRHRHRSTPSNRRLGKRRLRVEVLEPRLLLDAEGLPWSAPHLTISFAPDGTSVAGYESSLFRSLDAIDGSSVWQDAIVRGFETWAQHSTASISTMADSGDPFGTSGPTQGDPRFGDVRVAAIPMANDIIAMSVPHDEVISGTWAGDILFNSNAELNSIDDIFAIAVHEAGHVFGLGHSSDPNSPMYLHGISLAVTPTGADIKNLQRLYGVPAAGGAPQGGEDQGGEDQGGEDQGGEDAGEAPPESEHDREHKDDELIAANGVMLSANFQGAIRYDAAGQIFDATDVDFYQLAPIDDEFEQADVLTVTVRAVTPEGLVPSATIFDEAGHVVESTVLANANGEFMIQAKGADPRKAHFVEVKAAEVTGSHATGNYAFVATFGTRAVVLNRFAAGTLRPEDPTRSSTLHVGETRLVHFVLAADPVDTSTDSIAWTVIYDAHGSPVFRTATRPGESRSANTLLLTPGDYKIEFHSQTPDGTNPVEIDYRLLGRSISLPVGPDPIDPATVPLLPCSDPGAQPNYCYPDGVAIIDPIILPAPAPIALPVPVIAITPPLFDPYLWYWDGVTPPSDLPAPIGTAPPLVTVPPPSPPVPTTTPVTPTGTGAGGESTPSPPSTTTSAWQNSALPLDVNADGQVSPIDALLVINFLNASGSQSLSSDHASGSPFWDVNNDRTVSPIDALLVVNELGRLAGANAEGEAVNNGSRLAFASQNVTPATALPSPTSRNGELISRNVAVSGNTLTVGSDSAANLGVTKSSRNVPDLRSAKQPPVDQTLALEEAINRIATDLTILRLKPWL